MKNTGNYVTQKRKEEVLEANEKFYLAIKNGDIDQMEDVCIKDASVKCVHPGWPMLHGWDAVAQSWKNIFDSGGPLDIELRDISARISGDSAWVICIEKISFKIGDEVQSGFAQSTNIFKLDGSSWLVALHHASPIPAPKREVSSNEVLQ